MAIEVILLLARENKQMKLEVMATGSFEAAAVWWKSLDCATILGCRQMVPVLRGCKCPLVSERAKLKPPPGELSQ